MRLDWSALGVGDVAERRQRSPLGVFIETTSDECDSQSGRNNREEVFVRYKVAFHQSDEGYSVSVPGLPGCWSEGKTEAEALANIETAIREYLSVVEVLLEDAEFRR